MWIHLAWIKISDAGHQIMFPTQHKQTWIILCFQFIQRKKKKITENSDQRSSTWMRVYPVSWNSKMFKSNMCGCPVACVFVLIWIWHLKWAWKIHQSWPRLSSEQKRWSQWHHIIKRLYKADDTSSVLAQTPIREAAVGNQKARPARVRSPPARKKKSEGVAFMETKTKNIYWPEEQLSSVLLYYFF